MSSKNRRSSARILEKELEKEIKREETDEDFDDDEDDLPPPILERQTNCEESGESDGSVKGENCRESSLTPPMKHEKTPEVIEETDEDNSKGTDLLQALSHVFSVKEDDETKFADPFPKTSTLGRPRREATFAFMTLKSQNAAAELAAKGIRPNPISKSTLLSQKPTSSGSPSARPSLPSTSSPSTSLSSSSSTTRFAPLRQLPPLPASSRATRGAYGAPPPLPSALRNAPTTGVGSNTSIGPARLLENRKRTSLPSEKEKDAKRSLLVTYNGGRAGENFRRIGTSSSSATAPPAATTATSSGSPSSSGTSTSSSTAIDAVTMLREQSPVQIQVTAGAARDSDGASEVLEVAVAQKDAIGSITKAASNHNVLLGSMIINGLNTLQTRNADQYHNFSSDLYALLSKYRIH